MARLCPLAMESRTRTQRLWREFLRDPSQWWDNRRSKINPKAPDFQHRLTKEPLWVTSCYNPGWLEKLKHIDKPNYNDLLKTCAETKDIQSGFKLHTDVVYLGLVESDGHIGTTLIHMYADFLLLSEAQTVFNQLSDKDVFTWTNLMAAYLESEHHEATLHCFLYMEFKDVIPDAVMFVYGLKACSSILLKEKGQEMHIHIIKQGLDEDTFVQNSLIYMYFKLGMVMDAQTVFQKLYMPTLVSWNALITGYAENGCEVVALECYNYLQQQSICPDHVSVICCLNACGLIAKSDIGQEIHLNVVKRGLETADRVIQSLVSMYAKCCMFQEAYDLLTVVETGDVLSWNLLILALVEYGLDSEALNYIDQMKHEGISYDNVTYLCSLKACGNSPDIYKCREKYGEILKQGLEEDTLINNTSLDVFAKCGSLLEAENVFDRLPARDVVSWNALIRGYLEHGNEEKVLKHYEQLVGEGILPNDVTLASCLKSCAYLCNRSKGQTIHAEIYRRGLETDIVLGNALVDMYSKCFLLVDAHYVFEDILDQDIISWNALLAGYIDNEWYEKILEKLQEMERYGILPDGITFGFGIKTCGYQGAEDQGHGLFSEIVKQGLDSELSLANNLVDMYAKCGCLVEAQYVFDRLLFVSTMSWNVLVIGLAHVGHYESVFQTVDKMVHEGIMPTERTFIGVLYACSHGGLVDKGYMYFSAMSSHYGIIPNLEHYTCMADLLARAGYVELAVRLMEIIPFHPGYVICNAILAGCQKWLNVEVAFWTFKHLVGLSYPYSSVFVTGYA